VYTSLHKKARLVLGAGHSLIIDAVYDSESERRDVEKLAHSLDAPMRGLWLQASSAIAIARVAARERDASDATPSVVQAQFEGDVGSLSEHWTTLDATKDVNTTLRAALAAMRL
jgi:predicted kinase